MGIERLNYNIEFCKTQFSSLSYHIAWLQQTLAIRTLFRALLHSSSIKTVRLASPDNVKPIIIYIVIFARCKIGKLCYFLTNHQTTNIKATINAIPIYTIHLSTQSLNSTFFIIVFDKPK